MTRVPHIDETVTIGGDLTVGRIGYGAMQLTGPKVWGEYPDHDKGVALLREVVAAGVTYIDTADVYGPHSNEELIREALHPYPDDLLIATKGGFVRSGPEYADMGAVGNRHYLRQAAYMSARRLGLHQIDLYYLHTPKMTDARSRRSSRRSRGCARTASSATSVSPTSAPTSSAAPCRSPTSPP
jgi:pyridoxine 4-dehydrogenase